MPSARSDAYQNPAIRRLEEVASDVLAELRAALGLLLESLPAPVGNAAQLQRVLGVDSKLAWQTFRVATAPTPLAAGVAVPARVSLNRLVARGKEAGAPAVVLDRVRDAFDAFEQFVCDHAGDRREFDALAAAWSPEERERLHTANREAIYRAAGSIRGVTSEATLLTRILYPAASRPELLDSAGLFVTLGLRRLRRGAPIEQIVRTEAAPGAIATSVTGEPVDPFANVMLEQFCSSPTPRLNAHPAGEHRRYVLEGDEIGMSAAVDIAFAEVRPENRYRFATADRPMTGSVVHADSPSRRLIMDMLLHDGVIEPQTPEVSVYDLVPQGILTRYPDPARALDKVAFDAEARAMGRGLESFRSLHVPRYTDMLAHICDARGWDGSALHGYRIEIEYPVYSWQTVMAFRLPQAP